MVVQSASTSAHFHMCAYADLHQVGLSACAMLLMAVLKPQLLRAVLSRFLMLSSASGHGPPMPSRRDSVLAGGVQRNLIPCDQIDTHSLIQEHYLTQPLQVCSRHFNTLASIQCLSALGCRHLVPPFSPSAIELPTADCQLESKLCSCSQLSSCIQD